MIANEIKKERDKLMELLAAQHNPDQVAKRKKQIMEFLSSSANSEKTGVIALALEQVLEDTLFSILKTAEHNQNTVGARKIIMPD